ncbi:MAG: UPF0175 family protein [Candidatus Hydrogenedentes bacterium]|nr:UPF0175 family protein [Candidatus Hydrogenedentota bacterium]
MSTITISLPDLAADLLHVSPDAMGDELRMLAAVKLYEMGRMSSGAAAEFAGIPRTVFLQKLGDYGVDTFDFSEEEFEGEADLA